LFEISFGSRRKVNNQVNEFSGVHTANSYSAVGADDAEKYIFSINSKISFCKFGLLTLSSYLFGFKSLGIKKKSFFWVC
jgi:hypothetical protein